MDIEVRFLDCYDATVRDVHRYASRLTGDRSRAEDLVQDVYLQLLRHARSGTVVDASLGWLLVAWLMLGLLQLLGRRDCDDRVPGALFLWTWGSSVLANAVFFGRPLVALTGGVVMGLVAVPYARYCVPCASRG